MKTWTYLGDRPASLLSRLGTANTISLYTTMSRTWRLQLTHRSTGLTDYIPSQIILGYTYRKLAPHLRAQVGVGDGRFQDSRTERRLVGGWLAACVPELFVDSRVLGHIRRRGRVKDQAQDNGEE